MESRRTPPAVECLARPPSPALEPEGWGVGILGVHPDVLRPLLLVCIRVGTYRPGISATVETIRYVETSAK